MTCQEDLTARLNSCQERIQRLSMCMEVARLISSSLDLGEVLDRIMTTSRELMQADASSLMLLDEKSGELVFQVAQGQVGERLREGFRLPKGHGIAGFVCETGEPLLVEDAYKDPRFHREFDEKTGYRTRSVLCVPLKVKDRIIGVSQVINKLDGTAFTHEDLETFTDLCRHAAIAIQNARMHEALLLKERMDRDLALASIVQHSFLPKELPRVQGYSFGAYYSPALEVGGDFYDFIPLKAKRWGVLIGDVSGKGVASALYMARLTSDFRTRALQVGSPSRVVNQMNEELCRSGQRGTFVTMLYLVLEPADGVVRFVNAGHLPPLLWKAGSTRPVRLWGKGGPPLGILENLRYGSYKFRLEPGDCLLLLTDGLLEARDEKEESFGWDRIEAALCPGSHSPQGLIEALVHALEEFKADAFQTDDITMVTLGVEKPCPRKS
jgi:sigma-B regulation protein RsbU (phosphoserine phosphatase)